MEKSFKFQIPSSREIPKSQNRRFINTFFRRIEIAMDRDDKNLRSEWLQYFFKRSSKPERTTIQF